MYAHMRDCRLNSCKQNASCFLTVTLSSIKALRDLSRSENWKLCRWYIYNSKKLVLLLFLFTTDGTDSKWTKYCNIKAFYKTRGVFILVTRGTIFSANVWINGGQVIFQYKPCACLLMLSLLKMRCKHVKIMLFYTITLSIKIALIHVFKELEKFTLTGDRI